MQRLGELTDSPRGTKALVSLCQDYAGDLALDVGANIGQAARLMGPYFERIVAFEPCRESFFVLNAERAAHVEARNMALSRAPGTVWLDEATAAVATGQLVTRYAAGGHPEWGAVVGKREVEAETLDGVVRQEGRLPRLVKVDTEGHEPDVLAGGWHTLALGYTAWFIEVHSHRHWPVIKSRFAKAGGYEVERIEHEWLEPDRARDHFYAVARPCGDA